MTNSGVEFPRSLVVKFIRIRPDELTLSTTYREPLFSWKNETYTRSLTQCRGLPHLGEAVDGGLAGTVGRMVVKSEKRSGARHADDLSSLAARDHPLRALLAHDEGRPDVHLNKAAQKRPSEKCASVAGESDQLKKSISRCRCVPWKVLRYRTNGGFLWMD